MVLLRKNPLSSLRRKINQRKELTMVNAMRDEMSKYHDMVCVQGAIGDPVLLSERRWRVYNEFSGGKNFCFLY